MTELVLVGNAKAGTIAAFWCDGSGLVPAAVSPVGVGCATFAIAGDLVLVATKEPAIVVTRLDRATGALTIVGTHQLSDPLAYLSLTPDQQLLLGASYHGGWAEAWPLRDGQLGAAVGKVTGRNLHSVLPSPDGRFAYLAALGEDQLLHCELGDAGFTVVQRVPTPPGAGPRHLVCAPGALYLLTEFTGQAISYARDELTGQLMPLSSAPAFDLEQGLRVSRFGADPLAERLIWGADVHLAGDWLLCSERTASTVTAIALSAGELGAPGAISAVEQQPRGFAVSPDGSHAVVAGERSGRVGLYQILPTTGELVPQASVESGDGPNWVRFV